MIFTVLNEIVTPQFHTQLYLCIVATISLMLLGLYFAINYRLSKLKRSLKHLNSNQPKKNGETTLNYENKISKKEWNSETLSLMLLNLECIESLKKLPSFALNIVPVSKLIQNQKIEVWFLIESDSSEKKALRETRRSLESLKIGEVGEIVLSQKNTFDRVGDEALVYLIRPGERLITRAVEEHILLAQDSWDIIHAPSCGKRGTIELTHVGVQPTVMRGRVWKELLHAINESELDSLEKRDHLIGFLLRKKLSHLFSPIPAVDRRKMWKEQIPSVYWFLQEYSIARSFEDSGSLDCYRKKIPRLQFEEKRRRAVESFRRHGIQAVRVVSGRIDKIFSSHTRKEITTFFKREHGVEATFCKPDEVLELKEGEVLILLVHLCEGEEEMLRRIHAQTQRGFIVSWFWDNHHLASFNMAVSRLSDSVCAGHSSFSSYLEHDGTFVLDPVELCVTQWTASQARRFFRETVEQKAKIVGGFVQYDKAQDRNHLVKVFQNALPNENIKLFPDVPDEGYFSMAPSERFMDWRRYGVSLCIPLFFDLSQRYFDSLLTGQIPLVVGRIPDLEKLLARDGPEASWTLYCDKSTKEIDVSNAKSLALQALEKFEVGGKSSAIKRHQFTVNNHMFVNRIERILELWLGSITNSTSCTNVCPSLHSLFESVRGRGTKLFQTVISVQHGLGNRMRAYASARVLSDMKGGDFKLHWIPDHHCEAKFSDLFANDEDLIEELPDISNFPKWVYYNLVDLEQTDNWDDPIDLDCSENILIKSQRRLNFSIDCTEEENEVLRMLRPSIRVERKISEINDVRNFVGVHIRMEGGADTSAATYDNPDQWDKAGKKAMFHWRSKSHWTCFVAEMRRLVEKEPDLNFFVASDQDFVIEKLKEEFGTRIHSIERMYFDRSSDQIIEGLADIFLLSRCRSILASNWSSFSEIAVRMGGKNARYAGIDF